MGKGSWCDWNMRKEERKPAKLATHGRLTGERGLLAVACSRGCTGEQLKVAGVGHGFGVGVSLCASRSGYESSWWPWRAGEG